MALTVATGTLEVVDYSFSRIDHGYAKSRGVKGCMRYLYGNGKGLTPPEVALFRSSGLCLGLNYEAGSGDFIGRGAGVSHAQAAHQFAQALGLEGHPIIFSADWDVSSAQYAAVGDAIDGALSILGDGNVGIYGHAGLVDYLFGRFGSRIYYWQTYAWSNGRVSSHTDLYQYLNGQNFAGGQVDFNDIRGRTFWAIGANNHATSGGNAVPIEEDSLSGFASDKQDQDVMAALVHQQLLNVVRSDEFPLLVAKAAPSIARAVWGQLMKRASLGGHDGAPGANFLTAVLEDTRAIRTKLGIGA